MDSHFYFFDFTQEYLSNLRKSVLNVLLLLDISYDEALSIVCIFFYIYLHTLKPVRAISSSPYLFIFGLNRAG